VGLNPIQGMDVWCEYVFIVFVLFCDRLYGLVRVRFPALPNFLRTSGSGTGSTQPLEDN
jgi:hypothetical protein